MLGYSGGQVHRYLELQILVLLPLVGGFIDAADVQPPETLFYQAADFLDVCVVVNHSAHLHFGHGFEQLHHVLEDVVVGRYLEFLRRAQWRPALHPERSEAIQEFVETVEYAVVEEVLVDT